MWIKEDKTMKNNLFLYILLTITILLLAGCNANIPQLNVDNLGDMPEEVTGVPKVVFIELFNTEGCPASKVVNEIMEEIVSEYGNTQVILVEEAAWGIYSTEETSERFQWYFLEKSDLHTPSVCFDGLNQLFAQSFSSKPDQPSGNCPFAGGGSVTMVISETEEEDNESNETVNNANNEDPENNEESAPITVNTNTPDPVILDPQDPNTIFPQTWGTGTGTEGDPWTGLKSAVDGCPEGGTVYLRAGYYQLNKHIDRRETIRIIGEERETTIIRTGNNHAISIYQADNVVIKNLTIDADAQSTGSYIVALKLAESDYAILDNIEVKNAGWNGIDFFSNNHGLVQNIWLTGNGHHGIHPMTTDKIGTHMYNTFKNIYTWENEDQGFDDVGNEKYPEEVLYNTYDNLHAWNNGGAGFTIFCQGGATITNCTAENNGIDGFRLWYLSDAAISDLFAEENGEQGVYLRQNNNIDLTNIVAKNNGQSGTVYSGFYLQDATNIYFTDSVSNDDQTTMTQKYGLDIRGDSDNITLDNCTLLPNVSGDIYNPEGAIVNEI